MPIFFGVGAKKHYNWFMNLPTLPQVSFRFIAGAQDAEALFAVHQARIERDAVDSASDFEDFPSLNGLRRILSEAAAEGRQDEWLVAEVHGRAVGYSMIEHWPEDDGTWVYLTLGWVEPEQRGRGIGTQMIHWNEARMRRMAQEHHPGENYEFAANASSTEQDATALLLAEGYQAGYNVLEMNFKPDEIVTLLALPDGVELRPVLPEHILAVAESVGAAYRNEYDQGRYAEVFDAADFAQRITSSPNDPGLWQVAWAGGRPVAQVLSVIRPPDAAGKPQRAEVFEVSVLPDYRRKGLARALLCRALRELQARQVPVIRLHTVAEFRTRASDLYRSVGFRVLKEFPRYRKSAIKG